MADVIWRPQKQQALFQARPEYEALYGGAAGGGKSDALVTEALRQVSIPNYRALILRKTFPQLRELIDKTYAYYGPAYKKAKYNSTNHEWTFPSGAKIRFGSMQNVAARNQYAGFQYDYIAFDELTHFTWDEYSFMFSRNRPSGPGTRVYIRGATNPGSIGHGWVKDRFVTAAPPMTTIWETTDIVTPDGRRIKTKRDRIFVPATVFDNQKLLDNNPDYLASLALLPEAEMNALLYGSWDSFDGQVFRTWTDDPAHYEDRKFTHVIAPFDIEDHWTILRTFDFGYTRPYSVCWIAIEDDGCYTQIAEDYGYTGTPNKGVEMDPVAIAKRIAEIEHSHPLLKGKRIVGVADPAIFDKSRGESIADMMLQPPFYVSWNPGDNSRIAGKMQFHYRLAFSEKGKPMFRCFNTCKNTIRTIPTLVYDERNVEDVNSDQEDHIYDSLRYGMMEHVISPRKKLEQPKLTEDPLDLRNDRFKWYRRRY